MKKNDFSYEGMEKGENELAHELLKLNMKSMREYWKAPYAAKENLRKDLNASLSFCHFLAKWIQSQNGKKENEITVARLCSTDKKEFKRIFLGTNCLWIVLEASY
jgi:hypothetical protein